MCLEKKKEDKQYYLERLLWLSELKNVQHKNLMMGFWNPNSFLFYCHAMSGTGCGALASLQRL